MFQIYGTTIHKWTDHVNTHIWSHGVNEENDRDGEDSSQLCQDGTLPDHGYTPLYRTPIKEVNNPCKNKPESKKKSVRKSLSKEFRTDKPKPLLEELEMTLDGETHPSIDKEVSLKLQLSPGSSTDSTPPSVRKIPLSLPVPPTTPPSSREVCVPCQKPDTPFPDGDKNCKHQNMG